MIDETRIGSNTNIAKKVMEKLVVMVVAGEYPIDKSDPESLQPFVNMLIENRYTK